MEIIEALPVNTNTEDSIYETDSSFTMAPSQLACTLFDARANMSDLQKTGGVRSYASYKYFFSHS